MLLAEQSVAEYPDFLSQPFPKQKRTTFKWSFSVVDFRGALAPSSNPNYSAWSVGFNCALAISPTLSHCHS